MRLHPIQFLGVVWIDPKKDAIFALAKTENLELRSNRYGLRALRHHGPQQPTILGVPASKVDNLGRGSIGKNFYWATGRWRSRTFTSATLMEYGRLEFLRANIPKVSALRFPIVWVSFILGSHRLLRRQSVDSRRIGSGTSSVVLSAEQHGQIM